MIPPATRSQFITGKCFTIDVSRNQSLAGDGPPVVMLPKDLNVDDNHTDNCVHL